MTTNETITTPTKYDGRKHRDYQEKPNTNKKTYKYMVEWKTDEDTELITKHFKTIKEITDIFGIPKSSIYLLIKNVPMKKYGDYSISRVLKPAGHYVFFE